ncbi:MAG: hypothetical protein WA941_19260 [Nitrososphaeraceae archaeon]
MLKGVYSKQWNSESLIKNARETLQWRRSKVLELSSEGRTQSQIAKVLQVSLATINSDIQYLRQQAKENIRKYVDEKLPFEYQKCLVGLENILSKTWDIVNNAESPERDRMQAISVAMQAYNMKIDLLSNATVVERAVQFIDRNKSSLTEQNNNVRICVPSNRSLARKNDIA